MLKLPPPSILSTEKPEVYDEIFAGLVASHKPWDFMSRMFVRMMADSLFEIFRCERHKALAVESKFRQRFEHQVQRAKADVAKKRQLANEEADDWSGFSPEFVRMIKLLDVQEGASTDIDELFKRAATELDHARALEAAIQIYGQLDEHHNSAVKRFYTAFAGLQQYRQDCARAAEEAKTIEGNLEQPPLTVAELKAVPEIEGGTAEAPIVPEAEQAKADAPVVAQVEGGNQ
jgi:hypothetical protein